MAKLNQLSKTVVYETSAWMAANPATARLALVALSAAIAVASILVSANPAAACEGLSGGGGGC